MPTMMHRFSTLLIILISFVLTANAQFVDHAVFDQLLKEHVDVNGRVDYAAWSKDSALFKSYLITLDDARVEEYSANEQLAFWINAYNASAIAGVLKRYPTRSIYNGSDKSFFEEKSHRVAGRTLSLDMIEKQILFPRFGDARLHFVLVCSAIGCPLLQNSAYTGTRVQSQIEWQARRFVNNSDKVQANLVSGKLRISPIFKWYESDFARSHGSVGAFIGKYLDDRAASSAVESGKLTVEYLDYDWTLNDRDF